MSELVVFLDFDGVLAVQGCAPPMSGDYPMDAALLHPDFVQNVNRIVDSTDANVVVSSSWRFLFEDDELQIMLEARGFEHQIRGSVPDRQRGANRDTEIGWWMEENPVPDGFVAVDDSHHIDRLGENHYVQVSPSVGLDGAATDEVIKLLKVQT